MRSVKAVQVRSGKAWSGLLRSGWARRGGQGKAMCVLVWSGAAGRGMAWLGGSGMLGSGKLDYGMAVGVWFGEARSVLAV